MPPLLDICDLNVSFGNVQAVRDVSFSIAKGEALGLVGESGSGKSVTSLAIMGLLPPNASISGSIRFEEQEVTSADPDGMRAIRGRAISMIFQEPMTALNPVMRVGDQIAEAVLAHNRVGKREAWSKAVEALRTVAIPEPERRARDYPHQLSGGQRQRVMIAMAVVNRPQLLIADEPTTALDVTVQAQILDLLADLRARFSLSMLFISHDLAVVSQVSDRVVVMYAGQIVESGPAKEMFRSAVHPYTRGLMNSVPTLRTDRTTPLRTIDAEARTADSTPLVEVSPGHWARIPNAGTSATIASGNSRRD